MSSLSTSISLPHAVEQPPSVTQALNQFHVVQPLWLRYLILTYPLLLALFILMDWLFFHGAVIINDRTQFFSYLALGLAFVFFVQLYPQVPETLRALWDRDVLRDADQHPATAEAYARFIADFDERLNGRWNWAAGITILVVSRLVLFYVARIQDWNPLGVTLGSLSYFLDGIGLWKLAIIAITVSRLPKQFNLAVQATHPDQSGGLGPIGDLCFINALVLLGPTLNMALVVIIGSSPDLRAAFPIFTSQTVDYGKLIEYGIFHLVLIVLILMELIVFLWPLYDIHREMVRQGAHQRQKLDVLAHQIDQINLELLKNPASINSADVQKKLDTLKWLDQVYTNNLYVPIWPFNRDVVLKFITSQAIPLLSLTGLPKPVWEAIKAIGSLVH